MPTEDLLSLVDPLIGTDSHYGFSTGNCLPLAAVPFGMNHWSSQTAEGSWFFDRRQRKLQGIRATHQPSPWIGDYGALTIMAQVGELMTSANRRASAFRLDRSIVRPDHLCFDLIRYRTRMELTPTKRGAAMRFRFPEGERGRIIFEPVKGPSTICIQPDCRVVAGYTEGNSGGCPPNFACYFFARFSAEFSGYGTFVGDQVAPGESERDGERAGGYVEFSPGSGSQIELRIATSLTSVEQAARNLAREIGDESFEEALERTHRLWNETLGRIAIEDEDLEAKRIFYTCLYRSHLFPRIWHEEDADNSIIHYSPYDGEVRPGVLYTDNGFWDTYRTEYPLLTLLHRDRVAEILQGWTNAYKEGGWFPQWASPGYRACMVGTHIDAVMADAVAKGVTDFEVDTALSGMLKHAYEPGDEAGSYGRIGIEDYKRMGYVAADRHDASVARSLDYAYDDWCIAQVARLRGRETEAASLLERSLSYRSSWHAEAGFMRARNADGSWVQPFDPYRWGGPYVEGGPWQSSWAVPHDVDGLIEMMGGRERFVARLDEMMSTPPFFEVGSYGFEIHEMTEMACADFGQYAHSNQPVHHVLYLYALAGRPDLTRHWVRRVMDELYTVDHFPGDEDNGEMSAWYVLSAMGLFPVCPGDPRYVLGVPRFRKMTIRPEGGEEIVIERVGAGCVSSVELNGSAVDGVRVAHEDLLRGARLRFVTAEE